MNPAIPPPLERAVFITGPTSAGKSSVAMELARRHNGEIVCGDAFQLYREFPVLSAQPSDTDRAAVPHHLYGAVPCAEEMDAARFATLALAAIARIAADGRIAFVVGGSGLYLQALTAGLPDLPAIEPAIRQAVRKLPPEEMLARLADLDPASVASIDTRNPRRIIRRLELCLQSGRPASELLAPRTPPPGLRGVVLIPDRSDLHRRIAADVASRLSRGAIDEVRAAAGTAGETARQILGWREISEHLAGQSSLAECHEKLTVATRQYAKRQLTWFRGKSTFPSIELSPVTTAPIERIARLAGLSSASGVES